MQRPIVDTETSGLGNRPEKRTITCDDAVALLRRAARAEPSVEEAYLKPLLAELAAEQQQQDGQQPAGVAGEDEDEQQQEARQQGEK